VYFLPSNESAGRGAGRRLGEPLAGQMGRWTVGEAYMCSSTAAAAVRWVSCLTLRASAGVAGRRVSPFLSSTQEELLLLLSLPTLLLPLFFLSFSFLSHSGQKMHNMLKDDNVRANHSHLCDDFLCPILMPDCLMNDCLLPLGRLCSVNGELSIHSWFLQGLDDSAYHPFHG
jgi:hypothetical protein